MKLETWVTLFMVSVGGALLLYPLRHVLTWDGIKTAAVVASSLFVVSWVATTLFAWAAALIRALQRQNGAAGRLARLQGAVGCGHISEGKPLVNADADLAAGDHIK